MLKRERGPDGRERFTEREKAALKEAMALCPALIGLRRFVLLLYELFGQSTDSHKLAEQYRKAILADPEFEVTDGLAKAIDRLRDDGTATISCPRGDYITVPTEDRSCWIDQNDNGSVTLLCPGGSTATVPQVVGFVMFPYEIALGRLRGCS